MLGIPIEIIPKIGTVLYRTGTSTVKKTVNNTHQCFTAGRKNLILKLVLNAKSVFDVFFDRGLDPINITIKRNTSTLHRAHLNDIVESLHDTLRSYHFKNQVDNRLHITSVN